MVALQLRIVGCVVASLTARLTPVLRIVCSPTPPSAPWRNGGLRCMAAVVDLTDVPDAPADKADLIDLTRDERPAVKRKRKEIAGAAGVGGSGAVHAPAPDPKQLLACPICWEDYVAKGAWVTVCGHHAHEHCLKAWAKAATGATCPKCAVALPPAPQLRFHPLYLM